MDVDHVLMTDLVTNKRPSDSEFTTPSMMEKRAKPTLSVSNLPRKAEPRPVHQGLAQRLQTDLMQADAEANMDDSRMAQALRSGEGGGESSQNQAQRVQVIPRQPEMGFFTEQRTAVLPFTFYCSMNMLDQTAPVVLRIRLNNHWNILKDTTLVTQAVNGVRNKGVSNDFCCYFPNGQYSRTNNTYLVPFPNSIVGPSAATATNSSFGVPADGNTIPAWRFFYERNWQAYSNYKTEVKITALNAAETAADLNHVRLFTCTEKYTTGQSNSQLAPTDATLFDANHWPFMTKRTIQPRNVNTSTSDYTILQETWTPNSVQKLNVFNDEDIKTWYPTTAQNGDLTECLTIMGYKHDLFPVGPRTAEFNRTESLINASDVITGYAQEFQPPTNASINLKVELKYHIVYKDLPNSMRYWKSGQANDPLLYRNETAQIPTTREFVPNNATNQNAG
jgi:hypothetical protein